MQVATALVTTVLTRTGLTGTRLTRLTRLTGSMLTCVVRGGRPVRLGLGAVFVHGVLRWSVVGGR
ncbi:hypothetical protein GCM10011374_08570 [Kocuria dechangensis]|uniref:Uncharacterized protein n=1 Tax=Kocuria dechangensis TaxID=1176249 RepID=A0A917LP13_9MICC|nr:hypothetical protein GCM10011374_08570 [Kocuria dechangensis]